jgi:N-acetylneuraminic acid mutarotase
LFGGLGLSTGSRGYLNDLWKYSNGEWTWVSGAAACCQNGVYGVERKSSLRNAPGARVESSTWIDRSGNLWLFGGFGYDSTGSLGNLNDLWEYSNGEWAWVSGSQTINKFGRYGTKGEATPNNVPGARSAAVAWIDQSANLWLFGGQGNDVNGKRCKETGGPCELNDLWRYAAGQWTWMNGSNTVSRITSEYPTRAGALSDNRFPDRALCTGNQ